MGVAEQTLWLPGNGVLCGLRAEGGDLNDAVGSPEAGVGREGWQHCTEVVTRVPPGAPAPTCSFWGSLLGVSRIVGVSLLGVSGTFVRVYREGSPG